MNSIADSTPTVIPSCLPKTSSTTERTEQIAHVLETWLRTRLETSAIEWLAGQSEKVSQGDRKGLFLSFGLVPRKTGKSDLNLTPEELQTAHKVRPGWHPEAWSVDQAARTWLILQWPHRTAEELLSVLDPLFNAGEVRELVALYSALPLLPYPEAHQQRCEEGIRSNIRSVLFAIVYDNPFPAENLCNNSWNQLVLKTLFNDISLSGIWAVDQRNNPELVDMLLDFAEERQAAGRQVPLDLWRPMVRFLNARATHKLQQLLESGTPDQQRAAFLTLVESNSGTIALDGPASASSLRNEWETGKLNWELLVPRTVS